MTKERESQKNQTPSEAIRPPFYETEEERAKREPDGLGLSFASNVIFNSACKLTFEQNYHNCFVMSYSREASPFEGVGLCGQWSWLEPKSKQKQNYELLLKLANYDYSSSEILPPLHSSLSLEFLRIFNDGTGGEWWSYLSLNGETPIRWDSNWLALTTIMDASQPDVKHDSLLAEYEDLFGRVVDSEMPNFLQEQARGQNFQSISIEESSGLSILLKGGEISWGIQPKLIHQK